MTWHDNPLTRFLHFVTNERTVALEIFMSFIAICFSVFFYLTPTKDLEKSILISHMISYVPPHFWSLLFGLKAFFGLVGNGTGSLKLRLYGTLLHTFIWGVVAYLTFMLIPFPSYVQGIYSCFFLAGIWQYLSIKNETRIYKSGKQTMTIHIPRQILEKEEIHSKL